jgi:site-specific DNA-cytosine methylase
MCVVCNDRPQAYDNRSKEWVTVPPTSLLFYGFTCLSRSPANNNRSKNKGCVQNGTEKTGEAFAHVQALVSATWPEACIGENLKELLEEGPDSISDASYIKDWFNQHGY